MLGWVWIPHFTYYIFCFLCLQSAFRSVLSIDLPPSCLVRWQVSVSLLLRWTIRGDAVTCPRSNSLLRMPQSRVCIYPNRSPNCQHTSNRQGMVLEANSVLPIKRDSACSRLTLSQDSLCNETVVLHVLMQSRVLLYSFVTECISCDFLAKQISDQMLKSI